MKAIWKRFMILAAAALAIGLVACAVDEGAPAREPTATSAPTAPQGATSDYATVEVPAPVEKVDYLIMEKWPPVYRIDVTTGLPSGCAKFAGITHTINGDRIEIEVTNTEPAPGELVACTAIYGYATNDVTITDILEAGMTYTVVVNGEVKATFEGQGGPGHEPTTGEPAEGYERVEVEAPIENVEVIALFSTPPSIPPQYAVAVTSGLPGGCAKFERITHAVTAGLIEIEVINTEPAPGELVACTRIYGHVTNTVELGSDLETGQTYAVVVNGEEQITFEVPAESTGEPGDGPPKIEVPAPVEEVEVMIMESWPPQYRIQVTSGLPSGCAEFASISHSIEGTSIEIEVLNTEPAPGVLAKCTAIYGYATNDVVITDVLEAGTTYTVVVNGKEQTTFEGQGGPGDEPSTEKPGEGYETAEVAAPIENVEIIVGESFPPQYTVQVTSGLPGGCAHFESITHSVTGNTVEIEVINTQPAPDQLVACTMIYGYETNMVELGSDFEAGETYTVSVNGEVTNSFLARGERTGEWVVETSPIETVEVMVSESDPPRYQLNVVSRLPRGSSCSAFNGYDIARPFAGRIEITVTHVAVAPGQIVPCTADLPVVTTEIPLGSELAAGETYTVSVNGEVTNSFLVRDERTEEWTVETSPIETVEVVISESDPPRYQLNVVSRLPQGSSCSAFNGYDIARPFAGRIEVTITHLAVAPGQVVPCTRDLPVVSTEIPLGSELTAGETYTVLVNGTEEATFVAQ